MEKLNKLKCEPCEGGVKPLTRNDFSVYLDQVPAWEIFDNDTKMRRDYQFKDFKEALSFVNRIGEIAEAEGHHPNITLHSWNKVELELYTHTIGGLSINDFVCAVKFDDVEKN